MKVLVENEYVKSWTDNEEPIIYSRVLKMPESSLMLQNFCDMHLGFIREVAGDRPGSVYSICDTYIMEPFMFEILVNYYSHILPRQQRAGLAFKAFVKPRNFDLLADVQVIQKNIEHKPIGLFESFDKAFYFIKSGMVKLETPKKVFEL